MQHKVKISRVYQVLLMDDQSKDPIKGELHLKQNLSMFCVLP